MTEPPDRLAELGAEFRRLRAESVRLKQRTAAVRERTNEIRPALAKAIVEALDGGRGVQEIVKLTGYDRDSIRKIRLAADNASRRDAAV